MIITLQSQYLDRYLWLVQDKDGLSYPQVDSGPAPATPDEPTYINVPYPEIADTIARHLWIESTGLLPIGENYEPTPPAPSEPVYINVPYPEINDLPGQSLSVTFDGVTVANRLWVVLPASNIFTQQFQRAFKGLKNFG